MVEEEAVTATGAAATSTQQYQAKINSMQKYVPFLSKLIARLEREPQNEAKVVQMQLLYKILINTEDSASIEELNKCEEALEAFYKIYETPATTSKKVKNSGDKQTNQEKESPADKEQEADAETDQKENGPVPKDGTEKASNNLKSDEPVKVVNVKDKTKTETDSTVSEKKEDSEECKEADKIINDEIKLLIGRENDKPKTIIENSSIADASKKEKKQDAATAKEKEKIFDEPKDNEKDKGLMNKDEEAIKNDDIKESLNKERVRESQRVSSSPSKNTDKDEKENKNNDDEDELNENEKDIEEEEDEENVELIKMPEEADADEMILPDSADDTNDQRANQSAEEQETDDEEEEDENDTKDEKDKAEKVEKSQDKEEETENKDLLVELARDGSDKKDKTQENRDVKKLEAVERITNEEEETPEEPELVALLEEEATSQADEDEAGTTNDGGYDPLTCEETNDKTKKDQANKDETDKSKKSAGDGAIEENIAQVLEVEDDDDDDDEVEVIELRNSPICLDSDDEEVTASVTPPAAAAKKVPSSASTTQERTFARKSTAKPANVVPQIQKKSKNLNYLQNVPNVRPPRRRVVDTIDLLDSSEDEANLSGGRLGNKRARITVGATTNQSPAKRQLLSALKKNNKKAPQQRTQHQPPPPPQLLKRAAAQQTPRPVHLSTPQSNFLNAVNLQPAFAGVNPAAFSTQLSNKNVIIPNAFYGNPTRSQSNTISVSPPQRGRPRLVPKTTPSTSSNTFSEDLLRDRASRRWLENFLTQFSHPQHIASHSCFVLLQRVLKYKLFMRIKDTRMHLNTLAHTAVEFVDIQLMLDLRNAFYTNGKQFTDVGRIFCELASMHMGSKAITLTTEASTGRVSSRTRTPEELTLERCSNGSAIVPESPNFSGIFKAAISGAGSPALTAGARKRQRDDVEYKPDKAIDIGTTSSDAVGGDSSGERKRTLRTNRTRRFDNSFSYNEDEDPHEFEEEDEEEEQEDAEIRAAKAAVQRVVEQKRLEAQRQRERQAKSFENAFINAFTKHLDDGRGPCGGGFDADDNVTPSTSKAKQLRRSVPLSNETSGSSSEAPTSLHTNDFDAPLPPADNDDGDSLGQDDEPVEHRIYKVIPAMLTAASVAASSPRKKLQKPQKLQPHKPKRGRPPKKGKKADTDEDEVEIITCDDFDDDNNAAAAANSSSSSDSNKKDDDCVVLRTDVSAACVDIDPAAAPRNTDRTMSSRSKNNEWCVICNFRTPRIVHHYVNLHRGCEVYTARLAVRQVARLRRPNGADAQMHLYKNGQQQFEAACPFCEKTSRFMLPYWYQHFSMHTGEYAYRCTGCGIRKPTRSLLVAHINQPCSQRGAGVKQDFTFDARAAQIEARICMICNYVQLQRANVVAHLKLQHGIKQILPKHIQSIVLLKQPPTQQQQQQAAAAAMHKVKTTTAVRGRGGAIYEIEEIDDDDEDDDNDGEVTDNRLFNYGEMSPSAGNWDDGADPSDDLSFMICGMLDVQMNTE